MLPAQRNKVDVSKLTAAEQQAFRLYGKLPSRPVAKSQERKYFDSGDWALSKAGKQKGEYGKEIPTPDAIPHASPSPLVGGVSTPAGSSGTPGVGSPGSGISGMMSPPSSSSGIGLGPASSTSPPGSFVIGNTGGTSPTGSSGLGQSNTLASAPGAVPITSSSSSQGSNNSNNNPVSLSMSPGRVGIGGSMGGPSMHSGTTSSLHHHGLATSPTRSFGSFPIAHNHNSSVHHHSYSSTSTSPTGSSANLGSNNTPSLSSSVGVGIPIGGSNNSLSPSSHSNTIGSGNGIGIAGSAGNGGGSLLSGTSPMVSATTGNQIGKTQIRRTSQSEGTSYMNVLPAAAGVAASSNMGGSSTADLAMSPPPRSGLANSITPDSLMDDEEEDEGTTITPGARGEDEQVEGMELQ